MSKHPFQITDERGYFTLPLPKPGLFGFAHGHGWYRHLLHMQLNLFSGQRRRVLRYVLFGFGAITTLTFAALTASFLAPRSVSLAFSADTCVFAPQFLPSLSKYESSATFQAASRPSVSIAGRTLFSATTCFSAISAPLAGTSDSLSIAPLGNPLLKKRVTLTVGSLPLASARFDDSKAFGTGSNLGFTLSEPDKLFGYALNANSQESSCSQSGHELTCSLEPLALAPGAGYEAELMRQFADEKVETVLALSVQTLDPVIVTASSISEGATIYDSPTGLVLSVNKPLSERGKAELFATGSDTPTQDVSIEIAADKITVSSPPLTRSTAYRLVLTDLEAEDGSQLEKDYVLNFITSGGPKVVSSSIGSYKISTTSSVTLRFDVGLAAGQNIAQFATVDAGQGPVAASVTASGNTITINPVASLPSCTNFTVKLKGGLVSQYGIGGGEAWQQTSRTICQEVFSIGSSVRGRSILAYKFGTGGSQILYVGGMHGNERSGVYILNSLIDDLERRYGEIPANRSIVVIPNFNPDGFASNTRTNANNVDLNRNFASNDWQQDIQMPGGIYLPQGGGVTPIDQPESQALASYVQSSRPRLVMAYHAQGRIVFSNDAGDSIGLGQQYASKVGFRFITNANSAGTFEYATTGEFEDWLADKVGISCLLVELSNKSGNEYSSQRNAMWDLIKLP